MVVLVYSCNNSKLVFANKWQCSTFKIYMTKKQKKKKIYMTRNGELTGKYDKHFFSTETRAKLMRLITSLPHLVVKI